MALLADKNQKNLVLKYPLKQDEYKARILFKTLETVNPSMSEANQFVIDSKQSTMDALISSSKLEYAKNEDANFKTISDNRHKVQEIQKELDEFNAVSASSHVGNSMQEQGATCSLYLPMGIQFRDNVTYENFDVGAVGAGVAKGAGIAESMMGGLGSFVSGITGGASANMAKLAGIKIASSVGTLGDEVKGGLKIAAGVTVNPNSRVLFKQSNIREFAFSFKLVAKSKDEADEINAIIKYFRTELYPESIDIVLNDKSSISVGYVFPKKFQIDMKYDGDEMKGVGKIRPCFLRDVSTTYNSSTMAFHEGGYALEVDLNLSFQEDRALLRRDITEGGF